MQTSLGPDTNTDADTLNRNKCPPDSFSMLTTKVGSIIEHTSSIHSLTGLVSNPDFSIERQSLDSTCYVHVD